MGWNSLSFHWVPLRAYNLGMVKSFEAPGEPKPTVRVIGEVHEKDDDEFRGVIKDADDDPRLVKIPLENIAESERPRIVPGILFYCDIELAEDGDIASIRGIEFSDELNQPLPGPWPSE